VAVGAVGTRRLPRRIEERVGLAGERVLREGRAVLAAPADEQGLVVTDDDVLEAGELVAGDADDGTALNRPNDLAFGDAGRCWFTDPGNDGRDPPDVCWRSLDPP